MCGGVGVMVSVDMSECVWWYRCDCMLCGGVGVIV